MSYEKCASELFQKKANRASRFLSLFGLRFRYSCGKKIRHALASARETRYEIWAMWKWKVRRRILSLNRGCSLCIGFQFGRAAAKRKQIRCEGGGRTDVLFLVITNATRTICICPWNGCMLCMYTVRNTYVGRNTRTAKIRVFTQIYPSPSLSITSCGVLIIIIIKQN